MTFNVNHIVSGVAINLLGLGVTKYLANLVFAPISGNPRQSPAVPKFDTYSATFLSDWLGDLEKQQRVGISDVAGHPARPGHRGGAADDDRDPRWCR